MGDSPIPIYCIGKYEAFQMTTENQNDFQSNHEYQLFLTTLSLFNLDPEQTTARIFSKVKAKNENPVKFASFSIINSRMVNVNIQTTKTTMLLTVLQENDGIVFSLTDLTTKERTHILTLQPTLSVETVEPVD